MKKSNVFNNQLALIENQKLRNLVEKVLEAAPDYFYTMPESIIRNILWVKADLSAIPKRR